VDDPTSAWDREPPGQLAGLGVGIAAGLLLAAVWVFGAWDVALALTAVFIGLVVAVSVGAPEWRWFAIAMLFGAGVAGGALVLIFV
jgi:hypothetical protein